jgi:structural maintenance of chromosome 2
MEVGMKAAQKASGAAKTAVTGWRKKRDMLHGEIASADKESATGAAAATALEEAVAAMELQGQELRATLTRVQGDHGLAQSQTAAMAEGLAALGRDLKALDAKRDTAVKAANDASLEVKKLAHKLRQFDKECKDAVHALGALAKAHSWIADEHTSFGVAGGDFDFAATDMKSAYAKLKSLRLDQEQVSKKINKKVMGMIEKAEAEYQDLKKKRDVILHDKDTIQEVITELELKKSQALQVRCPQTHATSSRSMIYVLCHTLQLHA